MKWDGFRAGRSDNGGQDTLRSQRGTPIAAAFPEVAAGAVYLSDATALDGEPIVWSAHGRLTFEQLQNRLHRRGPATLQAASSRPAHFVAFDVLRLAAAGCTNSAAQPLRTCSASTG
ncbi:ATP-dependent DNA ligase [Streptomyces tauricus]|uniref:ATP-dependent DNA ligase n=1 Tax=Streptomyces tauricus TaxID=68274 RepID=UPI003811D3E4